MNHKTFSHPYWCHRVFNYMPLSFFIIALSLDINLTLIICFFVCFLIFSCIYCFQGKVSKTIEVNQEGIKGLTYNKSCIEIKWQELTELVEKEKHLTSSFQFIYLVSNDKNREIIFLDKIKGYEELLDIINQKSTNLRKPKKVTWL